MSVLFYRIHTVCSIQFYFINKIITEKKHGAYFITKNNYSLKLK